MLAAGSRSSPANGGYNLDLNKDVRCTSPQQKPN